MDNWKKVLGKPQIVKACDNIHVATGYGMGNVIFIDTMEGLVIVDTSDGCNATRKIKEDAGDLINKFPRNALGKVLKRILREPYLQKMGN